MPKRYRVYVSHSVEKSIRRIPLPWQVRILDVLSKLEINPYLGEKMSGPMSNKRKIRVWPYRIIYKIIENIAFVAVIEIEHRGNISYDKFF